MTQNDLIDRLIGILEEAAPGIRWDRDALDMGATESTGAVELVGEPAGDWADGHLVDMVWDADLWICVPESGSEYISIITQALMRYDDTVSLITWSAPERHYLYNIGKVSWRWVIHFWEPIEPAETDA